MVGLVTVAVTFTFSGDEAAIVWDSADAEETGQLRLCCVGLKQLISREIFFGCYALAVALRSIGDLTYERKPVLCLSRRAWTSLTGQCACQHRFPGQTRRAPGGDPGPGWHGAGRHFGLRLDYKPLSGRGLH